MAGGSNGLPERDLALERFEDFGELVGVAFHHVDGMELGSGGLLLFEALDAFLSRADEAELFEHLAGDGLRGCTTSALFPGEASGVGFVLVALA